MSIRKTAIAVRPYGDHIRQLVFQALANAGVDVTAPAKLVEGTNEELIKRIVSLRSDLLLIPFNVVRNGDQRTNGLELLQLLRAQVAWTRNTPAIMPVSVYAKVAFEGAMRAKPVADVFAFYEDELPDPGLPRRIEAFCAGVTKGA